MLRKKEREKKFEWKRQDLYKRFLCSSLFLSFFFCVCVCVCVCVWGGGGG